ncbi:MAG: hypothetical protein CVU05_00875 [Bacteroidetes bacterium HGW-Bacteroidetes-21]|jgi:hypothetical protein|nr:MAG: hypothetical protein CVU05_00875 [Bacteroidetes bacterium HGW-Bacteroidetes-21]
MKCSRCGSEEIVQQVKTGLTAENGHIGPKYSKSLFYVVEPMYCDICTGCGEILRFYILDFKDKKWVRKK